MNKHILTLVSAIIIGMLFACSCAGNKTNNAIDETPLNADYTAYIEADKLVIETDSGVYTFSGKPVEADALDFSECFEEALASGMISHQDPQQLTLSFRGAPLEAHVEPVLP
ncbi:MAG: hypothetical protein IKZ82_13095 [Clostridia bacterium]|nr:hypothetical protein [Clostridia bacterium]